MAKKKDTKISDKKRLEIYADYVNKIAAIKHFEVEQKKCRKFPH